jgi:hypothetical protein
MLDSPAVTPLPRITDRGRDLRLDFLRGLCLAKLVLSHGLVSPIHPYLAIAFFSAAEAFFFISGVVLGVVYRKRLPTLGLRTCATTLWRRAGTLWLANFVLVVAFHLWDLLGRRYGFWHLGFTYDWVFQGQWHWWSVLSFDQPYFLQVLPRYVVFLLATPAALWLLRRGKWWVVLTATVGLWSLAHLPGIDPRIPFVEHGRVVGFRISAWQLPFFMGLLIGWHREALAGVWRKLTSPAGLVLLGAAAVMLLVVSVQQIRGGWPFDGSRLGELLRDDRIARRLTGKDDLGLLRLANMAAFYPLVYWATDRGWAFWSRRVGWLMLPLGSASLYLFLVHIPLTRGPLPGLAAWQPGIVGSWLALLVDVAVLLLIRGMIRLRVGFGVIPR